ncbi:hypothetical protein [Paenibacillus kandeliae]|uniref:hypothetical protein n=1 Tax=Paenibacillus kandeliae TaxID=3231269 RepID=UPI003459D32E
MFRKKALASLLGISISTIVLLPSVTHAAEYNGDNAFFKNQGFSKTKIAAMPWYNDSSVAGLGYETILSNARAKWDAAAAANIGYSKASSMSNASLRFYATNDANLEYYGVVKPYDSSGKLVTGSQVDNPSVSYYSANLIMANRNIQTLSSSNEVLDVAVHELGHTLNLRHQPDEANSVMAATRVTKYGGPTSLDYANVDYKY